MAAPANRKKLLRPRKRSSGSDEGSKVPEICSNKKTASYSDDGDDLELFVMKSASSGATTNDIFGLAPLAALELRSCDDSKDDTEMIAKRPETINNERRTERAVLEDFCGTLEVIDEDSTPRSPSPPPPPDLIFMSATRIQSSSAIRNSCILANEIKQQLHDLPDQQSTPTLFSELPVFASPISKEEILRVIMPNGQIHRLSRHPDDHFRSVIEQLAMQERVPWNRVLLSKMDGTPIEPNDTPHIIGLKSAEPICAVVVSDNAARPSHSSPHSQIAVQVQMETSVKEIRISTSSPMEELYQKVVHAFGVSRQQLKIIFDGDIVSPSDTCSDLDLEGQEMFDARIA